MNESKLESKSFQPWINLSIVATHNIFERQEIRFYYETAIGLDR